MVPKNLPYESSNFLRGATGGADGSGVTLFFVYAPRGLGGVIAQQVRWFLLYSRCALEKSPPGGIEGGGERCGEARESIQITS
jgi:hypothetical protein